MNKRNLEKDILYILHITVYIKQKYIYQISIYFWFNRYILI